MHRFLASAALLGTMFFPLVMAADEQPSTVGMILDVSGSMAGKRATAMFEAAKLFVATIPNRYEIVIVDFNHTARSARFNLRTTAGRQAAIRHIDNLRIDGGTDYLCALKAANLPPGTPAVFLSDGENNDGPDPVLAFLKAHRSGTLFTVGIEAPPNADKLLSEMAALTGGSHIRVDESESLVKAFLDIAKQLGNYRTYLPKEDKVHCQAVLGQLIAFGFDAIPALDGTPPIAKSIFRHHANLPGEKVNLAVMELPFPTAVTIQATQKTTPQGRLAAILRQDLLRAEMDLSAPEGKAAMGGDLKVSTKFYDANGKLVDPRARRDLSSVFQLLDSSGKLLENVLAMPSVNKPALEATLKLPNQPGPVTVRNVTGDASQGPSFEAEQKRTLLLQKPIALEVLPAKVQLSGPPGKFKAKLAIKLVSDQPLQIQYSAELECPGLHLLEAKSGVGQLELNLVAPGPGVFLGHVIVHGAASMPVAPVRVPVEVTVKGLLRGLSIPDTRTLHLGPIMAASGKNTITTLEIPSLDADEAAYHLDVEDLSNGVTVIPFQADRTKLVLSKTKPATVQLTANIGNVPSGRYTATITVRSADESSNHQWKTNISVAVSEPLSVQPLDFGVVEVNKLVRRSLVIRNAGEALDDVVVVRFDIFAKGGKISATLPEKIAIHARQDHKLEIPLAVSPLVASRGLHKGALILRRTSGQELSVPVQVQIVGPGEGPTALLVAPGKIQLTAKPGEVAQFDLRIKFAGAAIVAADELTVQAGAFDDDAGKAADLRVAFKWSPGTKLTQNTPATASGFLVAPQRPGTYTAVIVLRSMQSGTLNIPIILEVRK